MTSFLSLKESQARLIHHVLHVYHIILKILIIFTVYFYIVSWMYYSFLYYVLPNFRKEVTFKIYKSFWTFPVPSINIKTSQARTKESSGQNFTILLI